MSHRCGLVLALGVVLALLVAALAGCSSVAGSSPGGSAASHQRVQVVHVTLSDQQVTVNHSRFTAGQPYQIVVTNTGQVADEFLMAPLDVDYGHMSWDQRQHAALYAYEQVAPGQTRVFTYTFPASAAGQIDGLGTYRVGCCDEQGMWYGFCVHSRNRSLC